MRNKMRFFRNICALSAAGLMALQLSVTAFADTAVETYTLGGLMIEVEPVESPKAASGLNYNGKEQAGAALPGLDQKYRLRSGVKSAVKPGSYEMELELIEPLPENIGREIASGKAVYGRPATPSDYTAVRFLNWSDKTTSPKRIAWSIAALKAEAPAGQKLSFNGREQTGVAAGNGYTLSGNKAVKPGSYKAVAKLSEGYVWKDGSAKDLEIAWSIEPLKVKAPEGKKLDYNGKEQTGVASGNGYTLTEDKALKPGSYKAVAKLQEGYVWEDGSSKDLEITWSITRKSSSSGSSGGGGSNGTGQKGLVVVREDGSVSTYGSTGSGSYSDGSSVISPGTVSGPYASQPAAGNLVPSAPPAQTPAPGSLSTNTPPSSKLPQQQAAQPADNASGSRKSSKNETKPAGTGSSSAGQKAVSTADQETSTDKNKEEDLLKEAESTKAAAENETKLAAEESSVIFEFGPDPADKDKAEDAENSGGTAAAHRPESFVTGLMSVLWKVLAVLGVLGIAGGVGYMIYSRKHEN